jgi:hypothetical protein
MLFLHIIYKIHRVDQMQHYHFSRVDPVGIETNQSCVWNTFKLGDTKNNYI